MFLYSSKQQAPSCSPVLLSVRTHVGASYQQGHKERCRQATQANRHASEEADCLGCNMAYFTSYRYVRNQPRIKSLLVCIPARFCTFSSTLLTRGFIKVAAVRAACNASVPSRKIFMEDCIGRFHTACCCCPCRCCCCCCCVFCLRGCYCRCCYAYCAICRVPWESQPTPGERRQCLQGTNPAYCSVRKSKNRLGVHTAAQQG